MAISETLVKNRFYRHCTNAATKAWERISFWTHCEDVELPNGKTLGTNNSLSSGIIDTLSGCAANTVSKNIAGANAVKELNQSLVANSKQFTFAYDSATGSYGYKAGGADTFHPFSVMKNLVIFGGNKLYSSNQVVAMPFNGVTRNTKYIYSSGETVGIYKISAVSITGMNANDYFTIQFPKGDYMIGYHPMDSYSANYPDPFYKKFTSTGSSTYQFKGLATNTFIIVYQI